MKIDEVEIYFLFHSGVAVKIDDNLLIFDYYRDKTPNSPEDLSNGVISPADLKENKNIYVFVTHNHGDHFNSVIFNWQEVKQNVNYILSQDVNASEHENYYFLDQDQELNINNLQIKTAGSTDQGVSFLVTINNLTIFHAGDLNWWHWKNFSEEQLAAEEKDFKREITKIKGKKIDIAFVPVDPRLEEYYDLAGNYFIKEIKPNLFIPIHFGTKFYITDKFADQNKMSEVQIVRISQRGRIEIHGKS